MDDAGQQLASLVDRAAIADLLLEFARRLDAGEWEQYAATFAPDAVFQLPWSERHGRAEIAAAAEADLAHFAAVMHYSTNQVIEIDGDSARSRSYLIGIHVPDASDPAMKQALENAADTARAGIAASDIAAAKADANKANAQITAAK